MAHLCYMSDTHKKDKVLRTRVPKALHRRFRRRAKQELRTESEHLRQLVWDDAQVKGRR